MAPPGGGGSEPAAGFVSRHVTPRSRSRVTWARRRFPEVRHGLGLSRRRPARNFGTKQNRAERRRGRECGAGAGPAGSGRWRRGPAGRAAAAAGAARGGQRRRPGAVREEGRSRGSVPGPVRGRRAAWWRRRERIPSWGWAELGARRNGPEASGSGGSCEAGPLAVA